jgi:catechol 2,3-dioxygenase-like lactoylglutathione lyase family enzyme
VARLDHIELAVKDWRASRDWWRDHLGFEVEFEDADQGMAALRDSADLTVFLCQDASVVVPPRFSLSIQVDDVDGSHQVLTGLGLEFVHPPAKVFWGYGAELLDPNGYRLRLWDETSMKQKGGA